MIASDFLKQKVQTNTQRLKMRLKAVIILLKILLLTLIVTDLALAKQKPFMPGFTTAEKVNIKADKMYYEQKTNLYFAEGNVVIQQEDATLKADKVTINTITQDAKAIGNVTLTEGENVLNCERLDVNLATKVGTISQATLFVKENNYHISGQSFEKLGENRYRVLNGTVTTCDGEVPDWKITGGEIDVTLEGVATLKKSTFQIKNIPIAYFPYFFYPVKIERQSGFMMPHFAYSSRDGAVIENSFFWEISDNTDATFYLDYASKKGVGEGVELRYVLNKRSKGTLYQYYIQERSKYFEDKYDPVLGRNRKRGIVDFEGEHYFNDTSYTKARMAWLSDRKIFNDYSREIKRFESDWNRTSLRSLEKNKSLLFYTKNWSQYTLTTELDYYKDLMKSDRTTLQKLPQINFSGGSQNITRTPLFFKFDSAYNNFNRDNGVEGQVIDLFPKISWPFNFANYLKFTPEIGMRGLFALNLSNTDSDCDYQKAVIDANAELSTTLLKVYNFQGKKISKLKHSIEPSILYRYNSDEDQEDFPFFEPMGRFFERNLITYSLTNRFTAKVLQPDGTYSEQEVGFLRIAQSYYFERPDLHPLGELNKKNAYYHDGNWAGWVRDNLWGQKDWARADWAWADWARATEGYNGHDVSDLLAELRFRINYHTNFKAKLRYNPYDNSLSSYNVFLLMEYRKNDYIRFGYSYVRDRLEVYNIKTRFNLSKSWTAFYETRHSGFDSKTLDSLYGLEYYAKCWSVRFNVEDKASQQGKDSETEFGILFSLAGLGELGGFEGSMD